MPSNSRPLRLRCSDIAKLSGLHDFADVPTLLTELLYQGLPELRSADATEWGIVWVSEEEELNELLKKAGAGTRTAFKSAAVARPADVGAASSAVQSVTDALATPAATRALSSREANTLRQAANHEVNTKFGNRHESSGLGCYAETTSCPVTATNDQLYRWPFPADPSLATSPNILATATTGGGGGDAPAAPAPASSHLLTASDRLRVERIVRARFFGESSIQQRDDVSAIEILPTVESCANWCSSIQADTSSLEETETPGPSVPVDPSDSPLVVESEETTSATASMDKICWWEPTTTELESSTLSTSSSSDSTPALPAQSSSISSSSSSSGRLVFSTALGQNDRKWLHALADNLGLGHYSEDTSEGRRIVLCTCKDAPVAADSSSEVEVPKEAVETPPTGSDTLFEVVGMVDGLSEELHCPGNDPSQWLHMRNVVVELKHRMRQESKSQPCLQCAQAKNHQQWGEEERDDEADSVILSRATNTEKDETEGDSVAAMAATPTLSVANTAPVSEVNPLSASSNDSHAATAEAALPISTVSTSSGSSSTFAEDCSMISSVSNYQQAATDNPEVKAASAPTREEEEVNDEGESSRKMNEDNASAATQGGAAPPLATSSTNIVPTEEQRQRAEVNRLAAMRRRRIETNRVAALERLRMRNNNNATADTSDGGAAAAAAASATATAIQAAPPPTKSRPQQPPPPSSSNNCQDLRRLRELEVIRRRQRPLRPPPLYDVIQLVSYCIMLGTKAGHLVEVKRKPRAARHGCKRCAQRNSTESNNTNAAVETTSASSIGIPSIGVATKISNSHTTTAHEEGSGELVRDDEISCINDENKVDCDNHKRGGTQKRRKLSTSKSAPELELTIHRICLKAAPQCHGDMFWKVIVPRLYETVSFVRHLRTSPSQRAAWVLAAPLDQWLQLEAACPFIVPSAHQTYVNLERDHAFMEMEIPREDSFCTTFSHDRVNGDASTNATPLPEVMCNICFSPLVLHSVFKNAVDADKSACGGCGAIATAGSVLHSCLVCEVHLCEICARACLT